MKISGVLRDWENTNLQHLRHLFSIASAMLSVPED